MSDYNLTKFVLARLDDNTTVDDLDTAVNSLETVIIRLLNWSNNVATDVPQGALEMDTDGVINAEYGLKVGGSDAASDIVDVLEGAADDNLASAKSIRDYVADAALNLSFGTDDKWKSLWVSDDASPKLTTGNPAYWIIMRENATESEITLNNNEETTVQFGKLEAEHPALTDTITLRPIDEGESTILFPVTGIWLLDFTAVIPNYDFSTPTSAEHATAFTAPPRCWAAVKTSPYAQTDIVAIDQHPFAYHINLDDGPGGMGTVQTIAYSQTSHTIHLITLLNVTSTSLGYQIRLFQNSGAAVTLDYDKFRLALLHIPTEQES